MHRIQLKYRRVSVAGWLALSEFFFDNISCERFMEKTDEPEMRLNEPTIGSDQCKQVLRRKACPYCETRLDEIGWYADGGGQIVEYQEITSHVCNSCGFWLHFVFTAGYGYLDQRLFIAQMQAFDIEDKHAPLAAVYEWLRRHPDAGYRVHHRKLEIVVRDILRDYFDCDFSLTTSTRDGGIDLYSFETNRGTLIVEVKGFSPGHKVGVEIVRNLAGVLVRENVCRGQVVATSGFTRDAQSEVAALGATTQRYPIEIELKSVHELLGSLKIHNTRSVYPGSDEYWESIIRPLATDSFRTYSRDLMWPMTWLQHTQHRSC